MFKKIFSAPSAVIGAILVCGMLSLALFAPLIAPYDPNVQDFRPLDSSNGTNLAGTDEFGRDVLSRVIFGSQVSVTVSFAGVAIGVLIGTLLGLAAGLRGGFLETAIMRVVDVLLAYPGIILGIAVITMFGAGSGRVAIAVAVVNVPVFARMMHGAVLKEKSLDYVAAAVSLGAAPWRIAFRHVLPNCIPSLLPQISLQLGAGILIEGALSFLGLGAQPPTASWGAMIAQSRAYLLEAPLYVVLPGLALMVFVVGFNLLGDAIQRVINPRSQGRMKSRKRRRPEAQPLDAAAVATP